MAGDYRSPIVGRDLLLGVMAGGSGALIVHILHALPPLGSPLNNGYPFFLTAAPLVAVGQLASVLRTALTITFAGLLTGCVEALLHNEWVAIILLAILLTLTNSQFEVGDWRLIYLANFLAAMILATVGTRMGVVAWAVAACTLKTFVVLFAAIRWSDWNFARPLLLLVLFAALAICGFRIAVARPVLSTALDD